MGTIDIAIKNYDNIIKEMERMETKGKKVVARTTADFKSRAPGWISQEVVKEYNIKKADIKEAKQGVKNIGSTKIKGVMIDNVAIEYQGRLLTITHFGMKPKEPIPWYECYQNYEKANTITAKIKRQGKRKAVGHSAFLAQSGSQVYIPFQRVGKERLPIQPIKTLSVPQMITNEKVSTDIHKRINVEMKKRLKHNIKRIMK